MRNCEKFPFKLVVKSALLAAILKNQLFFVSAVVHISPIGSAVRHCACNPLSQNATAHIATVAMNDVICFWGAENVEHFLLFALVCTLSANSTLRRKIQVSKVMVCFSILYFMILQCGCNLTQGILIFTPTSIFDKTFFTVILP